MLHWIIFSLLFDGFCLNLVSANCGNPGTSPYVKTISRSYSFDEGSILQYECVNKTDEERSEHKLINVPHAPFSVYERVCQRGKWSGDSVRCGKSFILFQLH